MLDAMVFSTIYKKKNKVRVRGFAEEPIHWLTMATAMLVAISDNFPEKQREASFKAICDAAALQMFGKEAGDLWPQDVEVSE